MAVLARPFLKANQIDALPDAHWDSRAWVSQHKSDASQLHLLSSRLWPNSLSRDDRAAQAFYSFAINSLGQKIRRKPYSI